MISRFGLTPSLLSGMVLVLPALVLLHSSMSPLTFEQQRRHGPAIQSFLSLLKQEEDELRYHVKRDEITQKEFTLSMNRIAVLRSAVLEFVKRTGEDRVPEYHVVTASELAQLVPEGVAAVKGAKPGDEISPKWRYVGTATRGVEFFIVERMNAN